VSGLNGWLTPVVVIGIGFVNWLVGRSMQAVWLLRSAWLMMASGLVLLVAAAFPPVERPLAVIGLVLLLGAMVCAGTSIARRETRLKSQ
jgi:hypothetical protein